MLPENGVLEERGQQIGSEVNVKLPLPVKKLCVHWKVTVGQAPTLLIEMIKKARARVISSNLSWSFDTINPFG